MQTSLTLTYFEVWPSCAGAADNRSLPHEQIRLGDWETQSKKSQLWTTQSINYSFTINHISPFCFPGLCQGQMGSTSQMLVVLGQALYHFSSLLPGRNSKGMQTAQQCISLWCPTRCTSPHSNIPQLQCQKEPEPPELMYSVFLQKKTLNKTCIYGGVQRTSGISKFKLYSSEERLSFVTVLISIRAVVFLITLW